MGKSVGGWESGPRGEAAGHWLQLAMSQKAREKVRRVRGPGQTRVKEDDEKIE